MEGSSDAITTSEICGELIPGQNTSELGCTPTGIECRHFDPLQQEYMGDTRAILGQLTGSEEGTLQFERKMYDITGVLAARYCRVACANVYWL